MISRIQNWTSQRTVSAALALAAVLVPAVFAARSAQAQSTLYTESVLFSFPDSAGVAPDGANSGSGLIRDSAGNFYGTTSMGGSSGLPYAGGTVFKITPQGKLTTLYNFTGGADGSNPNGTLIRDSAGNLYGTTYQGGDFGCTSNNGFGCGVVFKVNPTTGNESVLYTFTGQTDGCLPSGSLALDFAGNLYGTTSRCGANEVSNGGDGTIFKVDPLGNETVLYSFGATSTDGQWPFSGLVWDSAGNLYGTTYTGGSTSGGQHGNGAGTVFKFNPATGVETVLHSFQGAGDGANPQLGNLVMDSAGNLYGVTSNDQVAGTGTGGTVFEYSPTTDVETVLYNFTGSADGATPFGTPILDAAGNVYGTTRGYGALGQGVVFKIHSASKTEEVLYTFTGNTDGGNPSGGLSEDSAGNFYGTTSFGGNGAGVVFKLTGTTYTDTTVTVTPVTTVTKTLGLGTQALNTTSAPKTVKLKNTGTVTLHIGSILATGSFAISTAPISPCGTTLAPGATCAVNVTFTPTSLGKQSGRLVFQDTTATNPETVYLSGTGIADAKLTPASASFPPTAVGQSSPPVTFTLTNKELTGTLTGIQIYPPTDFTVSATTCGSSLAPNSTCTISVEFTPTVKGTLREQLWVYIASTGGTWFGVNLSGKGL